MSQPCPHCNHPKTHKHGDRRFKCPNCGKTFRLGKLSDVGRPAIGDRPMTPYERLKKHQQQKHIERFEESERIKAKISASIDSIPDEEYKVRIKEASEQILNEWQSES
jgi:hypothetical protein